MKNVYIVCWGSAGQDDDMLHAKAYSNVHGVYAFLYDAEKGLKECKDEWYNEIVNNPDYDKEDHEYAEVNTSVYGSVNDGYFEIDYFIGDVPCEVYIQIVEKEIQD